MINCVRNSRKYVALLLALALMFSMSITAFAATTSYGPYQSTKKLSIALLPGAAGTTYEAATINVTANVTINKIKVETTTYSHTGNPIIVKGFYVTSPSLNTCYVPVSSGQAGTSYAFAGESAYGTWTVLVDCECLSGIYTGYSSSYYKPTKITIN